MWIFTTTVELDFTFWQPVISTQTAGVAYTYTYISGRLLTAGDQVDQALLSSLLDDDHGNASNANSLPCCKAVGKGFAI